MIAESELSVLSHELVCSWESPAGVKIHWGYLWDSIRLLKITLNKSITDSYTTSADTSVADQFSTASNPECTQLSINASLCTSVSRLNL